MLPTVSIIARLSANCPELRLVAGAAEFAAVADSLTTHPAAFVIPRADIPTRNTLIGEAMMQEVRAEVGVLLAARDVTDMRGEASLDLMALLRTRVRKALLGWEPGGGCSPLEFSGGDQIAFVDGFVWWEERFAASYYLRAIQTV